nr:hypothetical protein [uncultured Pseudomonas sp.]
MSITNPYRGPNYEWGSICDQCGRQRNVGDHKKCSKRRKAIKQQEPKP